MSFLFIFFQKALNNNSNFPPFQYKFFPNHRFKIPLTFLTSLTAFLSVFVLKMAELVAVPLKKTYPTDVTKPLANFLSTTYSTADKPVDYSEQIGELSKLRNNAVIRIPEKYETSLEVIYRYYDQLQALEAKIPPTEVQIPFKWKVAFSSRTGIFGGKINLTVASLSYERVCVLFNIGALQSAIAASQSIENDDSLKLAAKLFQQSAGIFAHLRTTAGAAIQSEPTPDLTPDTLAALSALNLAQAQEIFVHKAIHDQMKASITAKLASQCEDLYAEALKLCQKENVKNILEKDWISMVAGKQAAFHGLAQYFQSIVCKDNKEIGEEIARLQKGLELMSSGQSRSGRPLFQEYVVKMERALKEASKDNDFIYHERVPEARTLTAVPRAPLVKPTPLPHHLSANFKDLFEGQVPVAVHQALAAYEVRKGDLVNREINELRKSTQLLNGVLASLNLPAALEECAAESVPQSIMEKSEHVCQLGGITRLEAMINELPELLQRNNDLLNEMERMLYEEEESDQQLRGQFKDKWARTPSSRLTETFKTNIAKYRELISTAINADKITREKYESHKRGIRLLSEGLDAMRTIIPCGTDGDTNSPSANHLKQLLEQVQTLKAERDVIEVELKSATVDMKEAFLNAVASSNTGINEPVMSTEALGRAYGPLQQQVKDTLARQQVLLHNIQEANTEFCMKREGAGGTAEKRAAALTELASAHAAFTELQNNLEEGTKFYNELTQLLVGFQNKVSDFCFARKTEKEELLKDLTENLSKASSQTPTVPDHHNTPDVKKLPPPRPPPPSAPQTNHPVLAPGSSHTLPYPSQPAHIMPMPYAPYATTPYPHYIPAPMPMSYNPYATIAGYHPQGYQQPRYPNQPYPQQQYNQWQPQ